MVERRTRGDDVTKKETEGGKEAEKANYFSLGYSSDRSKSVDHKRPLTENDLLTGSDQFRLTTMVRSLLRIGRLWGVVVVVVCLMSWVEGSEFPERECCDPVYPPNTATTPAAPVTHPVSVSKPAAAGEFLEYSNPV